jgi:ADP-ribosylglycohydrolase
MSTLLTFQRVITNTLRGAFLADAASMGTHWIYNPKEVMEKIALPKEEPEFQTPPFPNYYSSTEFPHHYEAGMLSPYGEQLLFMTRYVAHTAAPDMTGPSMSTAMYEWATTFGGRPDHATLTFIENMKSNDPNKQYPHCGADDDQGM